MSGVRTRREFAGVERIPIAPAACARSQKKSGILADRPWHRCGSPPPRPRRAACPPSRAPPPAAPCARVRHRRGCVPTPRRPRRAPAPPRAGVPTACATGSPWCSRPAGRRGGSARPRSTTPKLFISRVHLVADRRHDLVALGRQHVEQLVVGEHPAQRCRRRWNSAGRGCRPPPGRPTDSTAADR